MGSFKMRIFYSFILFSAAYGQLNQNEEMSSREMASSLLSRAGRLFFLEEMKQGNLERECIEEQGDPCNREENWEVFDNDELHRESWSKLKGCWAKLNSQNKFTKSNLRNCYDNDQRKLPL